MNWACCTKVIQMKSWTGLLIDQRTLLNWKVLEAHMKKRQLFFLHGLCSLQRKMIPWFREIVLSFIICTTQAKCLADWKRGHCLPWTDYYKQLHPMLFTRRFHEVFFIILSFERRPKGHFPSITRSLNTLSVGLPAKIMYPIIHMCSQDCILRIIPIKWLKTKGRSRRLTCIWLFKKLIKNYCILNCN